MAHHVQKKGARKANANRPKKSRLSDRNRKPTNYPALPDIPWMSPTKSLTKQKKKQVSIDVEPSDTLESLRNKLSAAGANAPEHIYLGDKEVTGSLADAGLTQSKTIDAVVYATVSA